MKLLTTKTESEKVTNMVGTFLNEDSTEGLFKRVIGNGYQHIASEFVKVSTIQEAPEKVVSTVTTFLPQDIDGLGIIRVMTKKLVLDYKLSSCV